MWDDHAEFLSIYVKKANDEPWTSEDHLILAIDSNSGGGNNTMDIAPGIRFQRPVDFAIRYGSVTYEGSGRRSASG
jgi:hypothetical protein